MVLEDLNFMDALGWWSSPEPLARIQSASIHDGALANSFRIQEIEDGQKNVDCISEELESRAERERPKTWRRRTLAVNAEGGVDTLQGIETQLVGEGSSQGSATLRGLRPHVTLFFASPHLQPGRLDAPPVTRHHRIVATRAVGRPIWEYKNDTELLKGLLCILQGKCSYLFYVRRTVLTSHDAILAHQRLCNKGWLHRDVNPSNILLTTDEEHAKQAPGFMIDFDWEYAPVVPKTATLLPPQESPDRTAYPSSCNTARSAPITVSSLRILLHFHVFSFKSFLSLTSSLQAAPHFLSRRQLAQLLGPELNFTPTPEDDVESLFIVLVYAVTRALACSDRMERLYGRRRNRVPDEEVQARKEQLLAFLELHWGGSASVHELHRTRLKGAFVMEIIESDPLHGAGYVGRWFAAHGQPKLVSVHLLKGILYRSVCKFVYLEQFDTDSSISDESESSSAEDTKATLRAKFAEKKLFTHDEVIKWFEKAIARLEAKPLCDPLTALVK